MRWTHRTALAVFIVVTAIVTTAPAPAAAAAPDLSPTAFTITPSTGGPGASIRVDLSIANLGDADAPATPYRIRLSSDTTLDAGDASLAFLISPVIAAGTTTTGFTNVAVPTVAPGAYYWFIEVDWGGSVAESNDANNVRMAGPFDLTAPDLSPTVLAATPPTASPGTSIKLDLSIANLGLADAPSTPYKLRFSSDATLDAGDADIAFFLSSPIPAGTTSSGFTNVSVPNVPPGTYYWFIEVDWNDSVIETDESNNVRSLAFTVTAPDFAPTVLTATPTHGAPGDSVRIDLAIANHGASSPAGVAYRLRLSSDAVLDPGDQSLAFLLSAPIAPGGVSSGFTHVTVPQVPLGPYTLFIEVDWPGSVYETDETNNVLSAPFSVRLNAPPVASSGGPYVTAEGATVALSGSATDPDGDPLALAWDLDDDGTFETAGGAPVFTAASIDGPATRTVTLRACDDAGLCATSSTSVSIGNVPPTATFATPASVDEGSPATLALVDPVDPAPADAATLRFASSCTGASLAGIDHASGNTVSSIACTYVDGPHAQPVSGRLMDDDGGATDYSATVQVRNVVPTVTSVTGPAVAVVGSPTTFTASGTDPSPVDTAAGLSWRWQIDGGAFTAFGQPGVATFTPTFTECGARSVTAQARDKDGGLSDPASTTLVAHDAHFGAPLDEGRVNTAKGGRVLPVKVTVGCGGSATTGLTPTIQLLAGDHTDGSETSADAIETYSASNADTTGVMRETAAGYHYNLRIPTAPAGGATYTIRVRPFGDAVPSAAIYVLVRSER